VFRTETCVRLKTRAKVKVIIFADFYQMDETDARATILDLSEFSEASHRFFDIKYSMKVKYSRIIESFIPCRPNLRQDEVGSLLLTKSFADESFEAYW